MNEPVSLIQKKFYFELNQQQKDLNREKNKRIRLCLN